MKFFYENKGGSTFAGYGSSLSFGAHLHNHIELVYMIEGSTKAFVDSMEWFIKAGDAFIVFPNQIHQYKKIDDENYFISIFPSDLCPEFSYIFKNMIPVSPVVKNAGKNIKILPLVRAIAETNQNKTAFCETLIRGYFLILLSELFQMTTFEKVKSTDGNTIKTVLNYCMENYTKDLLLDTISRALHISRYYLSHLFSQKLHMGFNEYIGMLRISEACRLLATQDKSITEISYMVGFNSTRTFNRLFLKYTGITPREYKKQHIPGKC